MAKYPPLFKRVFTQSEKEGKLIADIQNEFEHFWKSINKRTQPNREKSLALAKMQEACMWLTRSIAISGFIPDDDNTQAAMQISANKSVLSAPADIPATYAPPMERTLNPALPMGVAVKKKRHFASVITPNVED